MARAIRDLIWTATAVRELLFALLLLLIPGLRAEDWKVHGRTFDRSA